MALSHWDPDRRDGWMLNTAPTYSRRRRTGVLTPYGWFLVMSAVSVTVGGLLGFVIGT